MRTSEKNDLIHEVTKRAAEGQSGDGHNRDAALKDLKFLLPGGQWSERIKKERVSDGRPCLEFNQLNVFIDQVLGDARQNRPDSRVVPKNIAADRDTAEVLEDKIREIRYASKAEVAHDRAMQQQVQAGFGYWRIITEYEEDDSFNQEIKIKPLYNQFAVIWDPRSRSWDRMDADWLIVYDKIPKDSFKELYPKAQPDSIAVASADKFWYDTDSITIAEYFKRKYKKKKIYQLSDGNVVEKDELDSMIGSGEVKELEKGKELSKEQKDQGYKTVVKKKEILVYKIERYLVSGHDVLEGPEEWPSKYWPVVPVDGKDLVIEGKQYKRGLIRDSQDAMQAYNFSRTSEIETFALAPKAPILATAAMLEGHENKWNAAHKKTFPYLLFNIDPDAPQLIPQRIEPPSLSTAIAHSTAQSKEEIAGTIGIYAPHIQKTPAEMSGLALQSRVRESDVGTFEFIDNLARAVDLEARILLDLIPVIYDTTRALRLRKQDNTTRIETVNNPSDPKGFPFQGGKVQYDLKQGKYDVVTIMGPSYTTQRQEAAAKLAAITQYAPQLVPFYADMIIASLDFAEASKIADRVKVGVVPKTVLTKDEFDEMAKKFPAAMQPPPKDPVAMAMAQKDLAMAQKYAADAMRIQAETMGLRDENIVRVMQLLEQLQMRMTSGNIGQMGGGPGMPGGQPDQGQPPDMGQMGGPPQGQLS